MNRIKCIIVDDEPMAREVMENLLKRIDNIDVLASCKNALEAFQLINSQEIDLVFLDINMPEISGLSFARSVNSKLKIIFTTAYREYAVDGFDLQAVDYLLKPISFERLLQAINKYMGERNKHTAEPVSETKTSEYIFVRAERKMIKIAFDDILYIESIGDYLKIHLQDKTIVTRETMSSIEAELPVCNFFRSHRSYLVSKRHISSYTADTIEIDKWEIPISRGYRDKVMDKLK